MIFPRASCRRSLAEEFFFHDPDQINPFASLQDNILFGRIVDGRAGRRRPGQRAFCAKYWRARPVLCRAGARAEIRDRFGRAPALAVAAPAARSCPRAFAEAGVSGRQPRLNALDNRRWKRSSIGILDDREIEGRRLWRALGSHPRNRNPRLFDRVLKFSRGGTLVSDEIRLRTWWRNEHQDCFFAGFDAPCLRPANVMPANFGGG